MAHPHFRLKKSLREFGQRLSMPDESDKTARKKIDNEVFKKLQTRGRNIDRTVIFGSAAKHTGLWVNMDYDCVLFVNVAEFPKNSQEAKKLCEENLTEWEKDLSGIKVVRRPRLLKICLNGIDLDILLAFNALRGPEEQGNSKIQVGNVLQKVKNVKPLQERINFARYLSTSLCEKGVDFMGDQSPLTHELARVAKFWVQFARLSEYKVSGKSTIIELVCVEAMKRVQNENDILECFKVFLQLMINHQSWEIGRQFLDELDRDEYACMSQVPFIIDPSNPYNNMYKGKRVTKFLQNCEKPAAETLKNINQHPSSAFDYSPNADDWLVLVKLLYVKGSDRRHGIEYSDEPIKFQIAMNLDKVDVSNCSVSFLEDNTKYTNLMHFICYHAALIPRSVNNFEQYVDCLQQALQVNNTNIKIEKTVLVRGHGSSPRVNMVYPVQWCNGIWVGV